MWRGPPTRARSSGSPGSAWRGARRDAHVGLGAAAPAARLEGLRRARQPPRLRPRRQQFIIHLAGEHASDPRGFTAALAENGAEFPAAFAEPLHRLIRRMQQPDRRRRRRRRRGGGGAAVAKAGGRRDDGDPPRRAARRRPRRRRRRAAARAADADGGAAAPPRRPARRRTVRHPRRRGHAHELGAFVDPDDVRATGRGLGDVSHPVRGNRPCATRAVAGRQRAG